MQIRIFLSHPCGYNACGLAKRIKDLPEVDSVLGISDLALPEGADVPRHGLILIIDGAKVNGAKVSSEALERCSETLDAVVRASRRQPIVRTWPLLLVSPHATALAAELCVRQGGFDLTAESWAEIRTVDVESSVRQDAALCGSDAVVLAVQYALQRRILPRLGSFSQDATSVRALANLKQGSMILKRGSARIHFDMHQISSGLTPSDTRPLDIVANIATRELINVIAPERLKEFSDPIIRREPGQAAVAGDSVAAYLDECAASLELGIRIPKPSDRRVVILLVDDQHDVLADIKRSLETQPGVLVESVECGGPSSVGEELATAIENDETGVSDLSVLVGKLVFRAIESRLNELKAPQLWQRDGWRFFVVCDIRLHPRASLAGLEVIRRIRDAFPFVSTIAATVRRGLAYELQDEGADGYLGKSKDHGETAAELWKMVERSVWGGEAYYVEDDPARKKKTDHFFWRLLEQKHFLGSAELEDPRIRFACFRERREASEALRLLRQVPTGAVIGVLMDANASPFEIWEQLKNWKDHRDRKVVLLKRPVPGRAQASGNAGATEICPSSVLQLDRALSPEPPKKFDRRWALLVPRSAHCGALNVVVEDEELEHYRIELSERFGGATTNEVAGVWFESDRRIEIKDRLQRVEVLGRGTEGARRFVRELGQRILQELGQEEVFLQEDKVSVWSLKPANFPTLPAGIERDGLLDLPFAVFAAEATGL